MKYAIGVGLGGAGVLGVCGDAGHAGVVFSKLSLSSEMVWDEQGV